MEGQRLALRQEGARPLQSLEALQDGSLPGGGDAVSEPSPLRRDRPVYAVDGRYPPSATGLQRPGERVELAEVLELDRLPGEPQKLSRRCVRQVLDPRADEPPFQRGFAVGRPKALSRDAVGRRVGKREDPVLSAGVRGVVFHVDPHHPEDPAELPLAPRQVLRDAHAASDVGDPGVSAGFLGPALRPAAIGFLQGPRLRLGAGSVRRETLESRAGLRPLVAQGVEPPLRRHLLQRPVELERIVGVHPPARDHVHVVHDDVRVGDAALVVVVVDDRDVVVGEEPAHPCLGELPQRTEVHSVCGRGGQDEVLESPRLLSLPGEVVALLLPDPVHGPGPIEPADRIGLDVVVRLGNAVEVEQVAG